MWGTHSADLCVVNHVFPFSKLVCISNIPTLSLLLWIITTHLESSLTGTNCILNRSALVQRHLVISAHGAHQTSSGWAQNGAVSWSWTFPANRVVVAGTGAGGTVAVLAEVARLTGKLMLTVLVSCVFFVHRQFLIVILVAFTLCIVSHVAFTLQVAIGWTSAANPAR